MKKRYLYAVLAFMLILALPVCCLAETYYVDTANRKALNLRSGPSTTDEILKFVPFAARVNVVSFMEGHYWAYVNYNGTYGYVMTRYLSTSNPSVNPQPDPGTDLYSAFYDTDYYAYVVPSTPTGYVNLRWAPSMSAPVHGVRYSGAQLHVIASNGTWCQVFDENFNMGGFMMSAYLRSY